MSPKYPRPNRQDPLQAGRFRLFTLPRPIPLGIIEDSEKQGLTLTFTSQDALILNAMGICLDLGFDPEFPL